MYNDDILKEEFKSLVADIKQVYNDSGKRVSGEFEQGLELDYRPNYASLTGYAYLAGRQAGKMPPVKAIKDWIEARGIRPLESKMTTTSLAWAIAKNIAKNGTDKDRHLKIYEQVVTPERIQSILDRVTEFNIQEFVNNITVEMQLLTKNI